MKGFIFLISLFFYSNTFACISNTYTDSIPLVDISYVLKMVTPEKKVLIANSNREEVIPAEYTTIVEHLRPQSEDYIIKEKKYLTCNNANGIKILVYDEKYVFQKEIGLKQGQTCNLRNLTALNKLIYLKIICLSK